MTKLYLDHTEFKVNTASSVSDTIVMGGLLISHEEEKKLIHLIREVKSRYFNPDLPLKFNMRDLKKKYEEHNLVAEFETFLKDSAKWRKELFERSLEIDYTVVISVIKHYQPGLKKQTLDKFDLIGFAFNNILMRAALEVQTRKEDFAQVIVDWPDGNNSKPFNNEYYYAYWRGKTPAGQLYYSGTLKSIGFHDTVMFAAMNHSNMLQFADLLIGAMRDFLSCGLEEREYALGKELTEIILRKVRGFPKKVTHGLSISSGNYDLKKRIIDLMRKYTN
jgi:hypothetical protein